MTDSSLSQQNTAIAESSGGVPRPLRIGVFDSGVGGLTVLDKLMAAIPANYIYVGDTAWMPYGDKEPKVLLPRVQQFYEWFTTEQHVDAWVIACNTASMVCQTLHEHPYLEETAVPTVEPIGPVSHRLIQQMVIQHKKDKGLTKSDANKYTEQHVIILATPKTVASNIYSNTLQNFAAQAEVPLTTHSISGEGLARWIEAGHMNGHEIREQFERVMTRVNAVCRVQAVSHLILACTHYPHLYQQIVDALPATLNVLDPADAMVERLLDKLGHPVAEEHQVSMVDYVVTGSPLQFFQTVEKLPLKNVHVEQVYRFDDYKAYQGVR